jgi:hypothetical protein
MTNNLDAHVNAVLPYNGTSGWSGTDTSESRALDNDQSGKTSEIQESVINFLRWRREMGGTWKEFSELSGHHHGTVSGALSVLHKAGKISRLLETRNRCRVYVINEYVYGRETDSQGRKPKECPNCGHSL